MTRFTAWLVVTIAATAPLSSEAQPPEIIMVNMGGADCPPCVAWRRFDLPELQATEAFKSITFVHVEKTIYSTVPPRLFLPSQVKPLKEKLDLASGGNSGSPQVAILVNGEVYDYYFGTRSAAVVEKMIQSIVNGSPYPISRCIQRNRGWQCAVVGQP